MDYDYYVFNYDLAKSFNTKNKKTKYKAKKFQPEIWLNDTKKCVQINVNKNKNWKIRHDLETKIRDEPEYGTIKKTKIATEIRVHKPDSNQIEETFTFSKQEIRPREDNCYFKKGTKPNLPIYKKTYHKKLDQKAFKVSAKRQITLEDDFIVNRPKISIIKSNFLVDKISSNLSILIQDVSKEGKVSLVSLHKSVMSQEKVVVKEDKNLIYKEINSDFECPICCCISSSGLTLVSCNHTCCVDCWKNYANSFTPSTELNCCFTNCGQKLDLNILKLLLSETKYEKYEQIYSNFQNCPNEQCDKIFVNKKNMSFIKCNCGYSGCSKCSLDSHFPISCEQFQFYENNFKNEDLNSKKSVSTKGKFCPSCKVFIEKNGGCSHMRCVCGLDFCWECLKSYSIHNICVPVTEFKMTFNDWEDKAVKFSIMLYQYRSLVLKTLEVNLGHSNTIGNTILKDKLAKDLLENIKQKWNIEPKSFSCFFESLSKHLFGIVQQVSVMVEYLYAGLIFDRINGLRVNYAKLTLVKHLHNLCKMFNKIFDQKFDLDTLHMLILVCKRIYTCLNNLKS